jgi:hypothetical protein
LRRPERVVIACRTVRVAHDAAGVREPTAISGRDSAVDRYLQAFTQAVFFSRHGFVAGPPPVHAASAFAHFVKHAAVSGSPALGFGVEDGVGVGDGGFGGSAAIAVPIARKQSAATIMCFTLFSHSAPTRREHVVHHLALGWNRTGRAARLVLIGPRRPVHPLRVHFTNVEGSLRTTAC